MAIDPELLNVLACPACKTPVDYRQTEFFCPKCRRHYPVVHDIPNMIVEEARQD